MAKDIYDNIKDVKCSLDNAEQSFRKNNGLRGELDLMLAEASIKYLREKRGLVSVWNRQKLAALFAALLVLAGYGGWWYAGLADEPQESGVRTVNAMPQQAVPNVQAQVQQITQPIIPAQADKPDALPEQKINTQTTTRKYLAEKDMQQLIRSGRQALHDAD